jgi:superkiller protein 3
MGVALYQSGLLQQSTEAYKECLKYAPLDANAHNNLGLALWRSGQKNDAIAEWRKAIDCDANMAEAFTNLGRALHTAAK